MNIDKFFRRIGYQGRTEISLPALGAMQNDYLLSVPFENLNIHQGIRLNTDENALFNKIVMQNRGGVCYESNALFHDALVNIGFDVYPSPLKLLLRCGARSPRSLSLSKLPGLHSLAAL